jgi:hypothetical protein
MISLTEARFNGRAERDDWMTRRFPNVWAFVRKRKASTQTIEGIDGKTYGHAKETGSYR